MGVRRVYVEKKKGFNVDAQGLLDDLLINLRIESLQSLRIVNRYDIEGMTDEEYEKAVNIVFSEPPVDKIHDEGLIISDEERIFAIEYLPGQYDQRADSAAQCVQIITHRERPMIKVAKVIILGGDISNEEFKTIKAYCINPVESREASLEKPDTLDVAYPVPADVSVLEGFIKMDRTGLLKLSESMGFAMTLDDLLFCQIYFRDEEKRDPTVTEIRVIDTYWSDHCRHTTFLTEIEEISFKGSPYSDLLKSAYEMYKDARADVYGEKDKAQCLMDMATIGMKSLKKKGLLNDLDESDEINACSIVVKADIDGQLEDWLVMFKNETHNHPTEIEPFGGAATCLGGAIRDPLSGRSYVYQAMRVTGSGDPRATLDETIPGKLPQRKITTGAAAGYSSYGNQIGLATGQVTEIYHSGYVAKRMEIGAVIGATPKSNVVRSKPTPGDIIVLLGGQTGRDGCGGATGSSKAHTEESLVSCGAEVQKGNPPTERKIQRLFRDSKVTQLIKKCNDFGAGGVSVAIGELAQGLMVNLDAVPKKYEGLDGTELAISESQERMAVVIDSKDVDAFMDAANRENLEATVVAIVTKEERLKMSWRGKPVVDLSRSFVDSNGAKQYTKICVTAPNSDIFVNKQQVQGNDSDIKKMWLENLAHLNVCSQRGLTEHFDSTIGSGTVLMPYGGEYQMTPAEGMAAKLPVQGGATNTATLMAYGCNPDILSWSPFHGAVFAIVEAIAKVTAMGGDHRTVRLTLQEYFERLGEDPEKWGKPFAALLGALYAQINLKIPAIGGKDSMSGTFKDISVPPTLAAFAVCTADARKIISPEFKQSGNKAVLITLDKNNDGLIDFGMLDKSYTRIFEGIQHGKIISAHTVRSGGIAEAITKMCFGNKIGFAFNERQTADELFDPAYGSMILEISNLEDENVLFSGLSYTLLGSTLEETVININNIKIDLDEALKVWEEPLEKVFPTRTVDAPKPPTVYHWTTRNKVVPSVKLGAPRVFIPVFPGTNCEDDSARAFQLAGGIADVMIIKNLSARQIDESINEMANKIAQSQIIMIPGGFSGGDEPDGSGKFIAAAFKNPRVKDAVMTLLNKRDGLILGVCNGFQALIKLGLVPYGEIRDIDKNSPTLTFNTIGRHISRMVQTRVSSVLSPWLAGVDAGDIHTIAASHGEGRFVIHPDILERLATNGQIATQYVDLGGNPSGDIRFNPNGSVDAIEGITSPDGRVFGKMGHSERVGFNVVKNIPGNKEQQIFKSGVDYFR